MQDQRNLGHGPSDHVMEKMFVIMVVAVLLANVPLSRDGAGWVHTIPNATSIMIYEGMALQGSGPDVYILEDHLLRPFNSPDDYHYFYDRYHLNVHRVTDQLLLQFDLGRPIHRLVTCRDMPFVYALGNGTKRRFDNLANTNQSSLWDTVDVIDCHKLRAIPYGSPVPDRSGDLVQRPMSTESLAR